MPKSSNIKWRQSDKAKLSKTVGKFNAKLTRLTKKVPELAEILPERQSVKQLTSTIKTRNDFNKVINRLERFMVKGAEQNVVTDMGVRTTKYQLNEIAIQHRQINQQRAIQRKLADASTQKGTMGSIEKMNLKPKMNRSNSIPKESWDKYVKMIERQSMSGYNDFKKEVYKANYIKALIEWDNGADENFINTLKEMNADDVWNLYFFDPVLQLDFWYSQEEHDTRMEQMKEKLNEYLANNEVSTDKKYIKLYEQELERREKKGNTK